jgi:hypothetical protein
MARLYAKPEGGQDALAHQQGGAAVAAFLKALSAVMRAPVHMVPSGCQSDEWWTEAQREAARLSRQPTAAECDELTYRVNIPPLARYTSGNF